MMTLFEILKKKKIIVLKVGVGVKVIVIYHYLILRLIATNYLQMEYTVY